MSGLPSAPLGISASLRKGRTRLEVRRGNPLALSGTEGAGLPKNTAPTIRGFSP